jgi:hypothetical protein
MYYQLRSIMFCLVQTHVVRNIPDAHCMVQIFYITFQKADLNFCVKAYVT